MLISLVALDADELGRGEGTRGSGGGGAAAMLLLDPGSEGLTRGG